MADPLAADHARRTPGSTAVAPSLAALQLLLLPFPEGAVRPAAPTSSFADGYAEFRDGVLGRSAAAYLETIRVQAEALALVREAHARGAATLPPTVAAAVERAALGPRPSTFG